MVIITTTEMQNNFGKYLKLSEQEEVVITKNGKRVAMLVPYTENNECSMIGEGSPVYRGGSRVTYQEFLKITAESENRYEYIDGQLFLLASPLYPHQKAVREIFGEFIAWFRGKDCEPLISPFDVTLRKEVLTKSQELRPPDSFFCAKICAEN